MRVSLQKGVLTAGNDLFYCELSRATAGFPGKIGFAGRPAPVVVADTAWMRATHNKTAAIRPVLDKFDPWIVKGENDTKVWIRNIGWQDASGRRLEGFRLELTYEFHADGAVFVKTFFFTDSVKPGTITDFVLSANFHPAADENIRWALWNFPRQVDGQTIQDWRNFERNIKAGENRCIPAILPFVSFDFGRDERRDHHLEFFVESWNALTLDPLNTKTSVAWQGKKAALEWNFETRTRTLKQPDCEWQGVVPDQSYQWRNTWGWCLRRFPVERKHPPLRVFHYLDNYRRFPAPKTIKQVAAEGANLFIIHENWRFDPKNGEIPEDIAKLKAFVEMCHRHKMRVAVYVRGNEDNIRENLGSYILPFLKKNWDGIYMDYGSPMGYFGREEYAPGGRIHFHEHYLTHHRLRDLLGPEGVLISHSGSFFSAAAHTAVDAYLGGEQEKGVLLQDRATHAYFAGLAVAPAALWTAAFPAYRTKKVIPFLASTFQFPFLHLGKQFQFCSLDHPQVPSLIRFARPLWRLWEVFDGQTDIKAYTQQNTENVFTADALETGAALLVTSRGECLLTATNFSEQKRELEVKVAWSRLGLKPGRFCYALRCNEETTSVATAAPATILKARVAGYGVTGWLFVNSTAAWTKVLRRFKRPYPSFPKEEQQHRQRIEAIRRVRFQPPAWKEWFLRVSIPNESSRLEPSLLYDLYENVVELQMRNEQTQKYESLGYASRKGLIAGKPERMDYIWPGSFTPWIPLHNVLRSSQFTRRRQGYGGQAVQSSELGIRLALATRKGANEFYSFVLAELSPVPGQHKLGYEVIYNNEIDLDWSRLEFDIRFQNQPQSGI